MSRTAGALITLAALVAVLLPAPSALADHIPPSRWAIQFGTAASDRAAAIAVDPSGNTIVAGITYGNLDGPNAGSSDAFVRKLDATGATLWTDQFGGTSGDEALAVATDASGNVYVAGYTTGNLDGTPAPFEYRAFLRKYSPTGTVLWTDLFGTNTTDQIYGAAVDPSGNVIVVGYTGGTLGAASFGSADAFVRKYNSSGTELWTTQFGSTQFDQPTGVATDGLGNVLVSGVTGGAIEGTSAGGNDAFIAKFDSSGTQTWSDQFGTSENDSANSVATDPSGNVYVVGLTVGVIEGASAGNQDAFIRKLSPAGVVTWTDQFGSVGDDHADGVATDGAGNAYVVGYATAALDVHVGAADGFVREYSPAGAVAWTHQFGSIDAGSFYSWDQAQAVDADTAGNVYVTGFTDGDLEEPTAGTQDVFVRRYDSVGVARWSDQFGTSQQDAVASVATDAAGNVFAAGSTQGTVEGTSAGLNDAFVRKYDPLGTVLWTDQFGTVDHDLATAVATDAAGNLYVAGQTGRDLEGPSAGNIDAFVRKYSPAGAVLWTRQFGTSDFDYGLALAVDSAGIVHVAGLTGGTLGDSNAGSGDAFVRHLDASGTHLSTDQFGSSGFDKALAIATDPSGNLYVGGSTTGALVGVNAGSTDAFVRKYNPAGTVAWTDQFGTSQLDEVYSVASQGSGNVYAVGTSYGSLGGPTEGSSDAFLRRYSPSGGVLGTEQFGSRYNDEAHAVAFDSTGKAYVAGWTDNNMEAAQVGFGDAFIRSYTPAGAMTRTDQFGSGNLEDGLGLAIDDFDNVFIGGRTRGTLDQGGPQSPQGTDDGFVLAYFGGAPPPPSPRTLTVSATGTGSGSVTSAPGGISCSTPSSSGDCTEDYTDGTPVVLTAAPAVGDSISWSGCDSAVGNTCNLTMSSSRSVTATFTAPGPPPPSGCTIPGTAGDDRLEGTSGVDVICGFGGNDVIVGRGGGDELRGGEGNDTIYGKDGNDVMLGGVGNDDFFGGPGGDEMYGGDDNDRMWGGLGPELFFGEGGHDLMVGRSGSDQFVGGPGDDTMLGGDGTDSFDAGEGNNDVYGGSGPDTITAGSGNDRLRGGDGNDSITAGDGNNEILAGEGNNTVTTGSGDDYVDAGAGNDTITTGGGADAVFAGHGTNDISTGAGDDFVLSGNGADSIAAGSDEDLVLAGVGNNTINGNEGDDYLAGGENNDTFDGGADTDTCHSGSAGSDTQSNCESLIGSFL